ncbi:DUF3562 domain-containing protein [Rhodococcus aetherivorans]|uniref:DUF3562 domain-containing protein n=1 Tax=Rhodococcus aetherivorans TaxID=191292 RepID=UPI001E3649A8|nr:DUF3562 domain-containing protein [Rhodococcus aetherivorans]UGQ42419.1 DUF3562 domain-containing protein [Rhodococcus aetherivorans]
MDSSSEDLAIARAVHHLRGQFPGVSPDLVESLVAEVHARYGNCKIRDFVPLFVERRAREQLHKGLGGTVFQA